MKIVGIDPGIRATGYGFLQRDGNQTKLLEAGTIEPRAKDLLEHRIGKIYKYLDELLKEHKPNVMVLEKLYAHHQHPTTAFKLGHARGVICLLCSQHNISLFEYSVKRIRKALVGNGNATKGQTRSVVAQILKINEQKLSLDASDALALALGHIGIERPML